MKRATLHSVYVIGILLAMSLFVLHTFVLFETARLLVIWGEPTQKVIGDRLAGPAIVLGAFTTLFVTHLLEASVWAFFFWKKKLIHTFGEALYFTGTSLTALGYGDVVLVPPWRGLGPIMATNGILMFGCSTAFLFLVIERTWKFL